MELRSTRITSVFSFPYEHQSLSHLRGFCKLCSLHLAWLPWFSGYLGSSSSTKGHSLCTLQREVQLPALMLSISVPPVSPQQPQRCVMIFFIGLPSLLSALPSRLQPPEDWAYLYSLGDPVQDWTLNPRWTLPVSEWMQRVTLGHLVWLWKGHLTSWISIFSYIKWRYWLPFKCLEHWAWGGTLTLLHQFSDAQFVPLSFLK